MIHWETILETDNFIVEYDKTNAKYRVSCFEDNHFVDDVVFDANETVAHGEWIPIVNYFWGKPDGRYYCSECRRVVNKHDNFCPSCGARMDGGNPNA